MIYDRCDLLLRLSRVHCRGDQSPAEKTSPRRQKQALTFAAEYAKTWLVGKLFPVCTTEDFEITLRILKNHLSLRGS